ncbi:MAG: ribonuclease HIII [Candidatus Ancaeobacter aquaticus]|nr:ribonuclease HIII [Candidatus Ancaeobacter aquaticus]
MVDLIGKGLYVCDLDKDKVPVLRQYLDESGYMFKKVPYTYFSAQRKNLSVTMYLKGKLVIQGKMASEFVEFYLEPQLLKKITMSGGKRIDADYGESRIGVDESGKGDYFGPLVVASVFSEASEIVKLEEMGVRDSKKLSDKAVDVLYKKIIEKYPHSVVVIGPEKYNELYVKMSNLNVMLAWAHARAIENLVTKVQCSKVIVDQFADERMVKSALLKKGRDINLEQRHRAESDLVVAAASIVARGEFLKRLRRISVELNYQLLKGAGDKVNELALKMYNEKGMDIMQRAAKLHFKNTEKVKNLRFKSSETNPKPATKKKMKKKTSEDEVSDE